MRCVFFAAWLILATFAASSIWAQDRPKSDSAVTNKITLRSSDPSGPAGVPRVDWSHGMRVHRQIESWLRVGHVTEQVEPINVTDFGGMKLTLRWLGRPVSETQTSFDQEERKLDELADLMQSAKVITADAFRRIRPLAESDTPAALADIGARLQVDLQIAWNFKDVTLPRNAQGEAVVDRFRPGFDGLRLTSPDMPNVAAYLWPATAVARNYPPKLQVVGLLRDFGLSADHLPRVARADGYPLQTFEVIHIVRLAIDQPVMRLTRGNQVLPVDVLDTATLRDVCNRLAQNLARKQRENGSMAGTYRPTADRYQPIDATPESQACALYALARWNAVSRKLRLDVQPTPELTIQTAVGTLKNILLPRLRPEQTTAAAYFVLASCELQREDQARDVLLKQFIAWQKEDGSFANGHNKQDLTARLPLADQSLITAAMASAYLLTRSEDLVTPLHKAITNLHNSGATANVAALPWLAKAHEAVALLPKDEKHVHNPHAMLESLHVLLQHQVMADAAVFPTDVIGGFVLERLPEGVQPRPDWRTAHGLLMISAIARQEHLTEALRLTINRHELILRAGFASRFLAQLMFTEPSAFYVPGSKDALGGIRQSLQDNIVTIDATAYALLAMSELQLAVLE